MSNKILTKEEAKKYAIDCHLYPNGDYHYKLKDGSVHLIRDGADVLKGLNAVSCWSYDNGDYSYKLTDGTIHLIHDNVDLLEGLDAVHCLSYNNGDYMYKLRDGSVHTISLNADGEYEYNQSIAINIIDPIVVNFYNKKQNKI